MKPLFIVFEGLDGAGTTTQTKLLSEYLKNKGFPVDQTAEPSKGPVGSWIRSEILSGKSKVKPSTLSKLFAADRNEHLNGEILIALDVGETVVCDRYILSTLAYQGLKVPLEQLWEENKNFKKPDILFYLKVDPPNVEKTMARVSSRDGKKEIFEKVPTQREIACNYEKALDLKVYGSPSCTFKDAGFFANKVVEIDAFKSIEEIHKTVVEEVEKVLKNC